jgi:hypothetical protein
MRVHRIETTGGSQGHGGRTSWTDTRREHNWTMGLLAGQYCGRAILQARRSWARLRAMMRPHKGPLPIRRNRLDLADDPGMTQKTSRPAKEF